MGWISSPVAERVLATSIKIGLALFRDRSEFLGLAKAPFELLRKLIGIEDVPRPMRTNRFAPISASN